MTQAKRYHIHMTTNYTDGTEVETAMPAMDRDQVIGAVQNKLAMVDVSSWVMTVVPEREPEAKVFA
jgi:hypothetical protein